MEKNTFFQHKFFVFVILLFCSVPLSAQVTPSDSSSVRQDFSLPNPIRYDAFYDVSSNMYVLYPKIGNMVVGNPVSMTSDEYYQYMLNNQLAEYYREKSSVNNLGYRKDKTDALSKGLLPSVNIKNKLFESIFGGNKIELIPQGFASFDIGGLYQKIDNPLILPQNRTNFAIDIQQRIQLGLLGKVGENLQLKANYDTQSGFAFENRMNLVWQAKGTWRDLQSKGLNDKTTGGEDKIIKRVEFGNVNMPLSTSLIRGSESLFGLKTEFQLGKTYGTVVFSQQQGEARTIVAQGGGVMNTFKLNAIDYEDNQHYFLSHYFLNSYDNALLNYPQINSRISITRIEAWVLDQGSGNLQDQKGILGIRDLGEGVSGFPDNSQNGLYQGIVNLGGGIRDVNTAYNTINGQSFPNANGSPETYTDGEQFIFNRKARKLNQNEFKYHPQLGYMSLNQRLNDNQLLAVAYSYTLNGDNKVYKVGEFSEESPVLVTKLLKSNIKTTTTTPMWNLMMKNIYSLNSNDINQDGFLLNVYLRDAQNGKVNYLPNTNVQDINLLKLFNWDRLNMNNDLQQNGSVSGDGIFDFVPGITIDPENGKVIFTKAKPFGSYLQGVLGSSDPKFVFNELYDQFKNVASENRLALAYTLEGRFKGSQGTGISLGAINVPQGSVKVTANGVQLQEGVDYTVDYMLGSVNIINETVKQSGQAINISLENQLSFNTQRKRFLGLNLERKFNEHLTVGTTVVNYAETPLTQKVNFGQEQAAQVYRVKRSENGMISDPVTLSKDHTLAEAKEMMSHFKISGLPVVDAENTLVGIITNRDVKYQENLSAKVEELMTKDKLITSDKETNLEQAKEILLQNRVEKLPIVDKEFKLVGLITIKDIDNQLEYPNANKDQSGRLIVGAGVGVGEDTMDRVSALVEAGVDIIAVDSAHGHSRGVLDKIKEIRAGFPDLDIVGGNIVTADGAKDLIEAGANILKVGVGPGSICTTRVVAGVGVPQLSAIYNVFEYAKTKNVAVIADGGIKLSGDIVKAVASGASAVMLGSLLAGTDEAPGEEIIFQGRKFKAYQGMGSLSAMRRGGKERYFQSEAKKFVPEGIEGRVPHKGKLEEVVFQLTGGIRAGMGYCGTKDIETLQREGKMVMITGSGLKESHPHDVIITQEAPNYSL